MAPARFVPVFLAASALLFAAGAAIPARSPARHPIAFSARTMGTVAEVVLVADDSLAAAPPARAAQAVFARIDSLMSNWTSTSEVARLNREASYAPTPVQPEVATVLEASLKLWRESNGAFDITVEPLVRAWGFLGGPRRVPEDAEIAAALAHVGARRVDFDRARRTLWFEDPETRIDLGGIAKGYAADVAAETLEARGVTDALVNLSGNMVALGAPPGQPAWRIGIRDPRDRIPHFARITIRDGAISTSGQYEQFVAANGHQYGHILDPRTGRPAEGLISVTVVSSTALQCDAWDTPLFVLGPAEARRLARARNDIAVVLVSPGATVDTVWVENALKDRFVLDREARALFRVEYF